MEYNSGSYGTSNLKLAKRVGTGRLFKSASAIIPISMCNQMVTSEIRK